VDAIQKSSKKTPAYMRAILLGYCFLIMSHCHSGIVGSGLRKTAKQRKTDQQVIEKATEGLCIFRGIQDWANDNKLFIHEEAELFC